MLSIWPGTCFCFRSADFVLVEAVQAIRYLCLAMPVTQVSSWNAVRFTRTKWVATVWQQAIEALRGPLAMVSIPLK